jgi:hypothetical protein
MLAKRTSKNQITLPKAIVGQVANCDYFDVTLRPDGILLTPVEIKPMDIVLQKLSSIGMDNGALVEALTWARDNPDKVPEKEKVYAHIESLGITEDDIADAVWEVRAKRT